MEKARLREGVYKNIEDGDYKIKMTTEALKKFSRLFFNAKIGEDRKDRKKTLSI